MVDLIKQLKSQKPADSTNWYSDSVANLVKQNNFKKIFKTVSIPEIGKMFMYVYDPKTKSTLPYYDMFPLIICVQMYSDGFLGLNLHYLPPVARASLLNALMNITNNNKYDDTTKLSISYDLLKAASTRFAGYEQCVKRYLYGYIRSSLQVIESDNWLKVVLMPLQKWQVNPNKKYSQSPPY